MRDSGPGLKSGFTPLFPEENAQDDSQLRHSPHQFVTPRWAPHLIYPKDGRCLCSPQATLARRSSIPQPARAGASSPNAPLRLLRLAVPVLKAQGSREHVEQDIWRQPSTQPHRCCSPVSWQDWDAGLLTGEPSLSPHSSPKQAARETLAFSREGGPGQWAGSEHGEQERVGCCWDSAQRENTQHKPLSPHSPDRGHPGGDAPAPSRLALQRGLCEVSRHQGPSSLPLLPSAPASSLARLSDLSLGMKAGTDRATLAPSLTHPDLALVTPVLSKTLTPLSPSPYPPHLLLTASSGARLLPTLARQLCPCLFLPPNQAQWGQRCAMASHPALRTSSPPATTSPGAAISLLIASPAIGVDFPQVRA